MASVLWADVDESVARARLRRLVYRLETTAGASLIVAKGDNLELRPGRLEVDTLEFASLAQHVLGSQPSAASVDIETLQAWVELASQPLLQDLDSLSEAFESWRRAALDGTALLRRLNIKCGLEPVIPLIVADRDDEKPLRRDFEARSKAGVESTWLTRKLLGKLTAPEAPAAIRMRDAFTFDPYRASLGLAAAAAARRAVVCEKSPVKTVKFTRKYVDVIAEGGTIRASTAIVTTGTATLEFRQLRRHFKRCENYLVLTEPMPAPIRKQFGARDTTFRDTRNPHRRVRWTDDDRILVAGASQDETPERKRPAVLVQRTGQLMYELLTMFPAISGLMPEYGWELITGETADGLMYIGPHRNYPHHLFALGGGGDSVTGAFLAARMLARAAQGAPEKEDAVWGFTR